MFVVFLFFCEVIFVEGHEDSTHLDNNRDPECLPIPSNLTAAKTGQKAWDKCLDYQNLVFPCEATGEAAFGRVNYCRHDSFALILRGPEANPSEFPHMALLGALGNDNTTIKWNCGGALISERFILTTAPCAINRKGPVSLVKLASHKAINIWYTIKRIIQHPDYKSSTRQDDIALVELEETLVLDHLTVPACLPVGKINEERPILTGWGILYRSNPEDEQALQQIRLTKLPFSDCTHPRKHLDEEKQACYKDRSNSARQDTEGVLQVANLAIYCMYTLLGLSSSAGGVDNMAGIYTKLATYVPWIESVVWP